MRNPFRKRFIVMIVGSESGNAFPLPDLRFRHHKDAEAWVRQANFKSKTFRTSLDIPHEEKLTYFAVRELF